MVARPTGGRSRAKGNIGTLRSGALRVRVYAGIDPVTGLRNYLTEIIKPGPKAEAQAEAARARLVNDVAERRNPRTNATVDQLLAKYLDQWDGAPSTLDSYRGYVRNHVSPFIGQTKVGALDAEALDSLYAELRRCRTHCTGRRTIQHRTQAEHDCDERCRPHSCEPLSTSVVRHIHYILSGAYKRALRWRWVAINPVPQTDPPAATKPNPQPPSPVEAARIVNEAWEDVDWGALVWTAMTTGARRGELCAIRWSRVDLTEGRQTIWLRRGIRKENGHWVEADLKTHQQRRIAIDAATAAILGEFHARCEKRAEALGTTLAPDGFVFSYEPDGSAFRNPEGVSQRYDRLAERLKIETTFHRLRHYSATELIAAGVDVRTVAGRLGHAGGGTTTLRTYSAWVSEADQRAAKDLGAGMPARPLPVHDQLERAKTKPRHPYEAVAADIRRRALAGQLRVGDAIPSEQQLCAEHGISKSTARRAAALLRQWELLAPTGRQIVEVKPTSIPERPDDSANKTNEPLRALLERAASHRVGLPQPAWPGGRPRRPGTGRVRR